MAGFNNRLGVTNIHYGFAAITDSDATELACQFCLRTRPAAFFRWQGRHWHRRCTDCQNLIRKEGEVRPDGMLEAALASQQADRERIVGELAALLEGTASAEDVSGLCRKVVIVDERIRLIGDAVAEEMFARELLGGDDE
jgi:hypothetical protein